MIFLLFFSIDTQPTHFWGISTVRHLKTWQCCQHTVSVMWQQLKKTVLIVNFSTSVRLSVLIFHINWGQVKVKFGKLCLVMIKGASGSLRKLKCGFNSICRFGGFKELFQYINTNTVFIIIIIYLFSLEFLIWVFDYWWDSAFSPHIFYPWNKTMWWNLDLHFYWIISILLKIRRFSFIFWEVKSWVKSVNYSVYSG